MNNLGKRCFACLLAAVLLLALPGCSAIQQVADTVQNISDTVENLGDTVENLINALGSLNSGGSQENGGEASDSGGVGSLLQGILGGASGEGDEGEASGSGGVGSLLQGILSGAGAGASDSEAAGSAASADTGSTSGGSDSGEEEPEYNGELSGYFESLREEWKAEKNEGYVWTISIDDDAVMDVLGLVEANYHLYLSCSHVGTSLNGIYCGTMNMSFDADVSGVNDLLGAMGGSITSSDMSGWFWNDRFAMELSGDGSEQSDLFIQELNRPYEEMLESDPSAAMAASMLGEIEIENQPFETASYPVGWWFDWDYRMTDGDMSTYAAMSGSFMGVNYAGEGGMDASGSHLDASGVASSPSAGVFHERESKDYEMPFPYVIKVYNTGEVLFTLYSSGGGPVVIKFYGKIDRVPVSETTVIK